MLNESGKRSCSHCGAQLEATGGFKRSDCRRCGSEQAVRCSEEARPVSPAGIRSADTDSGAARDASAVLVRRLREDIAGLERGMAAIIADRDASVASMRFAAKVLVLPGILVLSAGIVFFSQDSLLSLALVIAGSVCTILAAMFFRSSLVYAHQCDRTLIGIDR